MNKELHYIDGWLKFPALTLEFKITSQKKFNIEGEKLNFIGLCYPGVGGTKGFPQKKSANLVQPFG